MSTLNFPLTRLDGSPLQSGDTYTGDNGIIYVYDGVKWVGHSPSVPSGSNSISNNGNTVQLDPSGNLVTPAYIFPNTTGTSTQVLVWPNSGNVLVWADQSGSASSGETDRLVAGSESAVLGTDGTLTFSAGGGIEYPVNGEWDLHRADGKVYIGSVDDMAYIDTYDTGIGVRLRSNEHDWLFNTDGSLTLPLVLDGDTLIGTTFNTNPPGHTLTLKHNGGVDGGSGGELKFDYGTAEIKVVKDVGITRTWTFDSYGNLAAPGNVEIAGSFINNDDGYLSLRGSSTGTTSRIHLRNMDSDPSSDVNIHLQVGTGANIFEVFQLSSGNTVYPSSGGLRTNSTFAPIIIETNNVTSTSTWAFGADGILTLPSGVGDIYRDGSSVLGSGSGSLEILTPPEASVAGIDVTAIGNLGMTAAFGPGDNLDDGSLGIQLPFGVSFAGHTYTWIYVSSNSYLVFANDNTGASNYDYIPSSQPGNLSDLISTLNVPLIAIDGADNSYQAVYYLEENTGDTFRIRYEGYSATSNSGDSNILWEVTFYKNDATRIDLVIESNGRNGEGTTGITDGVNNLGAFNAMAPNAYTIRATPNVANGTQLKFMNPNTVVNDTGSVVEVTIGTANKQWTTPSSNVWSIEEYNGGRAVEYNYPVADYSTNKTLTQDYQNSVKFDVSVGTGDPYILNQIWNSNIRGVRVNNVFYPSTGGGQGSGMLTIGLQHNVTYTAGDTVQIVWNDNTQSPVQAVWWDAALSKNGSGNFRGAIIEYHAYCSDGTAIGTIHVTSDRNMVVSHHESMSGRNGISNYEFWAAGGYGEIAVRRIGNDSNNTDNQIWIQWTSKIFYGSDLYC